MSGICLCRCGGWLGGGTRDVIAVSSSESPQDECWDCGPFAGCCFDVGLFLTAVVYQGVKGMVFLVNETWIIGNRVFLAIGKSRMSPFSGPGKVARLHPKTINGQQVIGPYYPSTGKELG